MTINPKNMYIDERLIKILETHKDEQIHVTYAIDLIKKIAEEYENQCKNQSVSQRFNDEKFISNVLISYRHDFGLLSEEQQNELRFECKEWMRAIKNNEPY